MIASTPRTVSRRPPGRVQAPAQPHAQPVLASPPAYATPPDVRARGPRARGVGRAGAVAHAAGPERRRSPGWASCARRPTASAAASSRCSRASPDSPRSSAASRPSSRSSSAAARRSRPSWTQTRPSSSGLQERAARAARSASPACAPGWPRRGAILSGRLVALYKTQQPDARLDRAQVAGLGRPRSSRPPSRSGSSARTTASSSPSAAPAREADAGGQAAHARRGPPAARHRGGAGAARRGGEHLPGDRRPARHARGGARGPARRR